MCSGMKPASPRLQRVNDIVLEDHYGNAVMVITDRNVYIGNPQEAALIMVKNILTTRVTDRISYNSLVEVYVQDNYRIEIHPMTREPKNWNKFVEEFNRVIAQKAFL